MEDDNAQQDFDEWNALAQGRAYSAGKILQNTRKQYLQKCKHFSNFLRTNHAELFINENDITEWSTLNPDILTEFFGYISIKRTRNGAAVVPTTHQTYEHVSGYASAIKFHVHTVRKQKLKQECYEEMAALLGGYKRKVADLKQNGEMRLGEGKCGLSFDAYKFLATLAIKSTSAFQTAIFVHLFLVLCWNLMARNVSVHELMYNHIWWENDSLVMTFVTQKNDKEAKHSPPKHIYANRKCPEICPILSFAIFMFTIGWRPEGSKKTVFGSETQRTFGEWLSKILKAHAGYLLTLGATAVEVGTHSFRKGIACFLAGIVDGPSAIAIYLRAGWSLGRVQGRYILECSGSDQLCGRAATGLAILSPEFGDLPPHFKGEVLTLAQWEQLIHGYSTFYPDCMRRVFPYLLASLVFHKNWLIETLHEDHPLFKQKVWTDYISTNALTERVLHGKFENPVSGLVATGVPTSVMIAGELVKLKQIVAEQQETTRALLENIRSDLPKAVVELVLQRINVEGAVAVTVDDVTRIVSEQLQMHLTTHLAPLSATIQQGTSEQQNTAQQLQQHNRPAYTWGGRLHPVPQGWKFGSFNARLLWTLWWDGESQCIPYRHLHTYDLCDKKSKTTFIKAGRVMSRLLLLVNKTEAEVVNMGCSAERDKLFSTAYKLLIEKIAGESATQESFWNRRIIGEMKVVTLYDKIVKTDFQTVDNQVANAVLSADTA